MDDRIKFWMTYSIKEQELESVPLDPSVGEAHSIKLTQKMQAVSHMIPLRGKFGSGYMFTFPDPGAHLKEFGLTLPDIDGMLEAAKESGRQEVIEELKAKKKWRKIKKFLWPKEKEWDYEDW